MRENVATVATFGFNGYITSFARLPQCGNCAATVAIMKGYYYMKTTTKESCKDCKYFKNNMSLYIDNMLSLGQVGGFLSVDGKIVGASIGEVSGDTLVVHIEKADTAYNGAYPTLASEFAKAFASDGVTFINREEDCGDEGLRISKMQYHPVEIREKIVVTVNTLFGRLTSPIKIYSDRLTVEDILPSDAQDYYRLYMDDALNIWWGYDYREDLNGETPSPEYFYNFQNNLKKIKEEYSFAVKENGKMVGELVLHNFNFRGGVEMGYRFFKEYQGKGFATESATALKKFVLQTLKPKMLMTRCFKQNIPSKNLIGRLGFSLWYETDTHFFFKMDLE
jgi:RimJ/RimL family protein N-acetyltransferase